MQNRRSLSLLVVVALTFVGPIALAGELGTPGAPAPGDMPGVNNAAPAPGDQGTPGAPAPGDMPGVNNAAPAPGEMPGVGLNGQSQEASNRRPLAWIVKMAEDLFGFFTFEMR